jgi:hypothetical protein
VSSRGKAETDKWNPSSSLLLTGKKRSQRKMRGWLAVTRKNELTLDYSGFLTREKDELTPDFAEISMP